MAVGRLRGLSRWLRAGRHSSLMHWSQIPVCSPSASHSPSATFRDASNSSRRVGKARGEQNGARSNEDGGDDDEEDSIMEEVEDKLCALLEEGIKRQKTIKYNIMRRKMTPSGAPERNLTWEAMETIRYLNREHPDEWTVERLSEGFSVSPAVIRRVVHSKFSPAPHRRAEQDAKVTSRLQRAALSAGATGIEQSRPDLQAGRSVRQLSSPGKPEAALVPVTAGMDEASVLVTIPVTTQKWHKDAAATTIWPAQDGSAGADPAEVQDETWDGQVLSEEELDEFKDIKSVPVLRVGNDFFDENGHFLYRI
ncbi:neugrin isoform X1 [Phycodurus eques]|uniref:neugrin isoform X1 n=1 Tax=Phycodurus eques TaxID=693459 RepID=UPI002ACEB9B2|nr:neugrin isoform X1 [Phycodurus eques]